MRLKPRTEVSAHLARCPRTAPFEALHPLDGRGLAHPKAPSSRPPAHLSPSHRVDHPVAQVLRLGTDHPCWPPPSQQVESEQCRFGNPNRFKLGTACSRLLFPAKPRIGRNKRVGPSRSGKADNNRIALVACASSEPIDAGQDYRGGFERLESEHWPDTTLDPSVILLSLRLSLSPFRIHPLWPSAALFDDLPGDAPRVGHDGERRVRAGAGREGRSIDGIEIVDVMGAAPAI
jgi:hypothetical protein